MSNRRITSRCNCPAGVLRVWQFSFRRGMLSSKPSARGRATSLVVRCLSTITSTPKHGMYRSVTARGFRYHDLHIV